jgi:hypothetical protein
MNPTKQETNKALVLEAFDTLFNKRDYVAAGGRRFSRDRERPSCRTLGDDRQQGDGNETDQD